MKEPKIIEVKETPNSAKPDYTVRRKIVYKGKMAISGCLYIVVKVKRGNRAFEAVQQIPGKQGEALENQVIQGLRDLIKTKYFV